MKAFMKRIWNQYKELWQKASKSERVTLLFIHLLALLVSGGTMGSMIEYSAPGTILGLIMGVIVAVLGYVIHELVGSVRDRDMNQSMRDVGFKDPKPRGAVEFLHDRYIGDDPAKLAALERERELTRAMEPTPLTPEELAALAEDEDFEERVELDQKRVDEAIKEYRGSETIIKRAE